MTYKEVVEKARSFVLSSGLEEKRRIIRNIYRHEDDEGLKLLAELVRPFLPNGERMGIRAATRYLAWLADLPRWRKERNRRRRQRKRLPLPSQTDAYKKEVKKEAYRNLDVKQPKPLTELVARVPGSFEGSFR